MVANPSTFTPPAAPQSQPSAAPQAQPDAPALNIHQSANLAPIQPLLALSRGNQKEQSSIQSAIKEKFRYHNSLENKTWIDMYMAGYQVALFIEGKQFVTPNRFVPGQWLPYTPRTNNEQTKRAMNLTRFYTTNCCYKWQLSDPDIVARAGVDTDDAQQAAEAADLIVEHYERKFFTPFITIQEALQGLCWGTYLWRVRYDDSQHSITTLQPIFGMQDITLGEGHGLCPDCGFEGPALAFPNPLGPTSQCPQCGSTASVQPPASAQIPGVIGQQQVTLGDLAAELIPFPECKWDLRYRAEDSSFFIHQKRVPGSAIRRILGNIRFPGGDSQSIGLDILDKLSWSGQSGGGTATQDERRRRIYEDPVTVIEYSLSADDIADIVISKDELSVSGIPLPAGPLVNIFPNGFTAQGLNDFNVLTGLYAERHSEEIVSGNWFSRALSGAGQGNTDLVEVQKLYNANHSQINTFLRATSTPAMMVRQEALGDSDRNEYLGTPALTIPIFSQNLPENMELENIVRPAFQPQNVPAQFFNFTYERLNDLAQLTSHVTDFSGGLPNVNNRTATGAQITQANSNALFTPPLQIKGEVRLAIAKRVIALYRKHFPIERYFPLKGKYGRQQGRYLSAADLKTAIEFEVVRDSELPRNSFTKREDYISFFQLLGGAAGYIQLRQEDPEFILEMERTFNIQLKTETFDEIASLSQQRVLQMKQSASMVQDPQALLLTIQPPIAEYELNQDLKAKWLAEWLDTDDGQMAPPNLRMAVQLLIQLHFNQDGIQKQHMALQQGQIQTVGAAPAAIGTAIGQHLHDTINPPPDNSPSPPSKRPHPTPKKNGGNPVAPTA